MIPEIRNHSYHLRIQDLDLISLVRIRLRGQPIEVYKYLNRFTTASARVLFNYGLNDRTRNDGPKLIVKDFNTSVAQYFYPILITTTWNALPNEVVSRRTLNSFRNSLVKHWAENPPNFRVNWLQSSMHCTSQVCNAYIQCYIYCYIYCLCFVKRLFIHKLICLHCVSIIFLRINHNIYPFFKHSL